MPGRSSGPGRRCSRGGSGQLGGTLAHGRCMSDSAVHWGRLGERLWAEGVGSVKAGLKGSGGRTRIGKAGTQEVKGWRWWWLD